MNRGEENFFESNAEVVLMGDRQLTDNFRLGFTAGGNFMYQTSRTLLPPWEICTLKDRGC